MGVLPTLGTTEFVQAQGMGEGLLSESLFGQDGSDAVGPFVAKWRIEQGELLDRGELLQQLFHCEIGPGGPGLAVNVLEQRDSQHAVESMHANLAVGPVVHRSPAQPVAVL